MGDALGSVMAVGGSQMTVRLELDSIVDSTRIGAMVKVRSDDRDVVGTIGSLQYEHGSPPQRVLVVDLLGELVPMPDGARKFRRGVSHHPLSGATVYSATNADLAEVYARPSRSNVRIGTLYHDTSMPAFALVDELLAKHFAILGSTGSGKSCAVTVILSAILDEHPNAHIVVLDPHNEYGAAFGDRAEVITVDNLTLPLWLFDFEEAVGILVRGGTAHDQESQTIILKDAIAWARRNYAGDTRGAASITVDTPVPFRVFDVLRFLNDEMGRLGKPDTAVPYLRLRARIESLRDDRRFSFLFSEAADTLPDVVSRLLRIPVNGKPLTILDLSGLPTEIADVVVSLSCRIIFDFALWSERERMPVLLVCEEAHQYVPADNRAGFAATVRAITRIAKEGRKYGVSLALVSQRPAELSTHALSQCGTVFGLRLGSDVDQGFMARTLPEAAHGMLAALPSLRTQEAIVSGEGVPLPMRIRFDDLPPERHPRGDSAQFSKAWQDDTADAEFRDEGIRRWRMQSRKRG
jgi:DNA helicase HerA-like ATPase